MRQAAQVALALTRRWQEGESPKLRNPVKGKTTRANGRVLRVLRRPENGLLLIYPVLPPKEVKFDDGRPPENTGFDPLGPPVIGVALSFLTAVTVSRIMIKSVADLDIAKHHWLYGV